mgnify:CR=1 FL=1
MMTATQQKKYKNKQNNIKKTKPKGLGPKRTHLTNILEAKSYKAQTELQQKNWKLSQ